MVLTDPAFCITAKKIGYDFLDPSRDNLPDQPSQGTGIWIDELKIPKGSITAIVGPSGSGKSTLLSILSGLRSPNKFEKGHHLSFKDGSNFVEITLQNKNLAGKIGYVFQEAFLIKSVTVDENLKIAQNLASNNHSKLNVDQLARRLKVDHLKNKKAASLSGGQAQRVAFIRALAANPEVLICDEPTSSLDDASGKLLLEVIKDWSNRFNRSVLWVTHNTQQAAEFADFLIKVDSGRVITGPNSEPFDIRVGDIAAKKAFIENDAPIIESEPDELVGIDPPIQSEANNSLDKALILKKESNFLIKIVLMDIYFSAEKTYEYVGIFNLLRKNILIPFRFSTTWVMCLGIIVFLFLVSAWSTGQKYFETELNRPELSHFTFETYSSYPLSYKHKSELQRSLRRRSPGESQKKIFMRREYGLQEVILTSDSNCLTKNSDKKAIKGRVPMVIFDSAEPLFAKLNASSLDKETQHIIYSRALFSYLENLDDREEGSFSGACLNVGGKFSYFQAVQIPGKIPGGGDRDFVMALPEKLFRDTLRANNKSESAAFTFSNGAAYFSSENREKILCSFGVGSSCDVQPLINPKHLKLNTEILEQIEQYSLQAQILKIVLVSLIGIFSIIMAISTSLAVTNVVKNHEKSFAILRAFGAQNITIIGFLSYHIVILFLNSVGLSSALFALSFYGVNYFMGSGLEVIEAYLEYGLAHFLISLSAVFCLMLSVAMLVVAAWLNGNKTLADKLQQV